MSSVNELINDAIGASKFSSDDLIELSSDKAQAIASQARSKFVTGNPRTWWLSLTQTPVVVEVDDSSDFAYLKQNWPENASKCYFIPETESDELRVFEVTLNGLIKVLSGTSFFEYYLVGTSDRAP